MPHHLVVKNLTIKTHDKTLLNAISFDSVNNEIVALIGPNGAGKTTLIKAIAGVHSSQYIKTADTDTGVYFDDIKINTRSIAYRTDLGIIYLPQHSTLVQEFSVLENLLIVQQYLPFWQTQTKESFHQAVAYWLKAINLEHAEKQIAKTLSGGQKRKLELVRSILMQPKILLLDEPFAGVDPKSIDEIKQMLKQLNAQSIGIVISDHHVDDLISIADRGYVLFNGEVICEGSMQKIIEDPYTKELYLGKNFYSKYLEPINK